MSGRLYDKRAWRRASKAFLARNPLCRYCEQVGKTRLAQVVDHIKPVSEAPELAMVEDNWQPLCTTCHNAVKQAEEKGGGVRGCGLDGMPLDPCHPWRQER